MRPPKLLGLVASAALVLAACGGDDSESGSPVDVPAEAGSDDAGSDDTGSDGADAGDDGADAGDDDGGSGGGGGFPSADDLPPEARAALEEAGIDLDDLAGMNPDDLDLDELMANLDEFASAMGGGDGGGTVTVGDVTYTVDADICFVFDDDFTLDGPAVGSDGSDAWVDAYYSITTREDMAEFIDESQLEFMFPEGTDTLTDMSLSVSVGQTGRFDFVEDQPSWSVYGGEMFDMGLELDWEFTGRGLRGSGEATDDNYVALEFGESVPIQFDVSCS